jgi:hypothetical protein
MTRVLSAIAVSLAFAGCNDSNEGTQEQFPGTTRYPSELNNLDETSTTTASATAEVTTTTTAHILESTTPDGTTTSPEETRTTP